jgi:hypothetical protein
MSDWRVCKRDGTWRVYDRGVWHETHRSLTEAHTAATQLAVACELFTEGGLTRLRVMQRIVESYRHYAEPLAQWEIELRDSFNESLASTLIGAKQ